MINTAKQSSPTIRVFAIIFTVLLVLFLVMPASAAEDITASRDVKTAGMKIYLYPAEGFVAQADTTDYCLCRAEVNIDGSVEECNFTLYVIGRKGYALGYLPITVGENLYRVKVSISFTFSTDFDSSACLFASATVRAVGSNASSITSGRIGGSNASCPVSGYTLLLIGKACADDVPFEDIGANTWISWYVSEAYIRSLTAGISATEFAPDETITRAQAVTMLWAAAGRPAPTLTECPFTDVEEGKYYYKPVLWAVENSITAGTTPTTFSPGKTCTNAEIATFVYAFLGRPNYNKGPSQVTVSDGSQSVTAAWINKLSDANPGKYFYYPIDWILNNTDWASSPFATYADGKLSFSPKAACSRAYAAYLFYNSQVCTGENALTPDTPTP